LYFFLWRRGYYENNNFATNELHICSQESGIIWGSSGTLLWLVADRFKRNFPAFRIDQLQSRRLAVCRVVQSVRSCLREWRNGWVSGAFGSSATICLCCLASKYTILNYQTFFLTQSNCFGCYQAYLIMSTVHSFGHLIHT